jgi:hypothetical protein
MTKRKTGYLANVLSIPPLIFRFQFNPELLSEKKSFEYRESNAFGKWEFDRGAADPGFIGFIGGLDDVKEWGSLLVGTKPQEAVAGKPRTFSLDFALDARKPPDIPDPTTPPPLATPDPERPLLDDDKRQEGRIEPSLAVLRSFMNPAWDPISDVLAWITGSKGWCPPTRPPDCNLKMGGIDLVCVMNDLNIKITHFKPDLTPNRAEVSITLTEQTNSISTTLDYIGRLVEVGKSYGELSSSDWAQALPAAGLVQNIFEL